MSCATGIDQGLTKAAELRKRACGRKACCSEPSPANKCCDEKCLIEIARRDCKNEHQPGSVSSVPTSSDEEPCQSHLSKAKATYSGILENIGCICKVLLSLNLESCCAKNETARERQTLGGRGLGEMKRVSSDSSSIRSAGRDSCADRACCSEKPVELKAPAAEVTYDKSFRAGGKIAASSDIKTTTRGTGDCCDSKDKEQDSHHKLANFEIYQSSLDIKSGNSRKCSNSASSHKPGEVDNCTKIGGGDCCSDDSKAKDTAARADECNDGCCNEETSSKAAIPDEDPRGGGCCSDKAGPLALQKTSDSRDKCGGITNAAPNNRDKPKSDSCCSKDTKCLSGQGDKHPQTSKDSSGCSGAPDIRRTEQDVDAEQIDLETGNLHGEHIIVSVQGMTCTGCETNLFKSLKSMPGVTNIKTSLALARAEFDLNTNTTVTVVTTIRSLEKKTGFVCSRMSQAGHELMLVVPNSTLYGHNSSPPGVAEVQKINQHTIRVIYHPELVGARDLIKDPFFQQCELAPVAAPPQISAGRAQLWTMLFKTLLSTILTVPVLVFAWADLPPRGITYGAVSLVLATIVQVYIAGPWYMSAFKALFFSRLVEVDFLVVLSTSTAYIYSVIAFGFLVAHRPLSTEGFFETSTLLVTLIMLGRFITTLARQRAVESISIESLQPQTAMLIDPASGLTQEIDSRLLQYGDMFAVLPDSPIATDGTVISGTSEVDESMITGEAILVLKKPGTPVIAGSTNHSGALTVRLTRLTGDNTIKAIGMMVDEAKSSKARFQEIADRVAGYFVPVILTLTVITFVVWIGVGKGLRGYTTSQTCINAMTYAISALIVSCPCAIGLAVPMVLVIAGGVAAKHGVIFKTAETIEKARKVSHVVFDKTGTLTQGKLIVEMESFPNGNKVELAPVILALTASSKHPVSAAIAAHLESQNNSMAKVREIKSIPGSGIKAIWGEDNVCAGNPYWLGVENLPSVKRLLSQGLTVFCVTINKGLVAVYGLRDTIKPEAESIIVELARRGIDVSIVSGDNEESVKSIARQLNIPEHHVRFRCTPEGKQSYIKSISTGHNVVMFCGDGTNDAVALAESSIGMHINGGTEIAKSAADAILIKSDLTGIITLMDLSAAFYRRVVFNFAWAFVYNTFAILLAAGAFPNVRIEPKYAALGEIVSVLPVIAAGVQLRWAKFGREQLKSRS